MSEPTRLLDGDLPADIANILQSATSDLTVAEEEAEKRRICATAASGRLWTAAPPPRSRPLRNVTWIGLAAAVLCASAVGVYQAEAPTAAESRPTREVGTIANAEARGTSEMESERPRTESEPAVAVFPSMRVDELPSASTAAAFAPPPPPAVVVAARRPPTRQTPPPVADELKLIDAARGALSAGQPDAAYSHIQRYRASFPTPHFVNEADALEVQALAALGRSDEARAKAMQFLEAHPRSPYTQRVRAAGLPSDAADTRH